MFPGPQPPTPDAPLDPRGDLAWAAFRYVVDELTPADLAAFERRLDEDQAACEAVAAAVERYGALQLVAEEWAAARGRRPTRSQVAPSVWAATAVAAAVGLVTWWSSSPQPGADAGAVPSISMAWSNLRDSVPTIDGTEGAGEPALMNATDGDGSDESSFEVTEQPANRPLPSWMMAAVAPGLAAESAVEGPAVEEADAEEGN